MNSSPDQAINGRDIPRAKDFSYSSFSDFQSHCQHWNICPQTPNIDRDYSNLTPTVHIIRWISDVYKDHLTPCIDQKGINQHRSANFKHSTNSKFWLVFVIFMNYGHLNSASFVEIEMVISKDDFYGVLGNGFVSFGNMTEHYFLSQEILAHQYRS